MNNKSPKNAVMIYPVGQDGLVNIGDYIQSIAASQFFPSIDCYLNREKLNQSLGEKVNLIANGWYMHCPENWPPSDDINPLFVALHINKLAERQLLNAHSIEYFKKHEPIGCRDFYTLENLKSKGVDAYFSGCLTLTLGQTYKRTHDDGKIYFTDAYVNSKGLKFKVKCALNLLIKYPIIAKIQKRYHESGIKKSLKSAAAFYTEYSHLFTDKVLTSAIYQNQQFKDFLQTDDAKFNYADALLKKYSNAHYVVTSRIHCALPCLAMGVPVLYIHNPSLSEEHNCRLNGLIQLFHLIIGSPQGVTSEIISDGKIDCDFKFENKPDYKPLSENLIARCNAFTSNPKR